MMRHMETDMDTTIARKMWRTLEPYHAMIYFVPDTKSIYERVGLTGRAMGYFASRAAALGAVSADVVIATFYNFNPALVRSVIPDAWRLAAPDRIVAARVEAVDAALRRLLGDAVDSPEVAEAAALAREATTACTLPGRPLYAGHAALAWPTEPHLALWQAITLLREYRGDGHVAALLCEEVDSVESLVIYTATGGGDRAMLQATRGWSREEWDAAADRLRRRGWLDDAGASTDVGAAYREGIEARTDRLALAPWGRLDAERCARLHELVRPLSKAISAAGTFAALGGARR